MAVEELGRVAHRVRGDGALALDVELRVDSGTGPPQSSAQVKNSNQKGRFSYMFRPKGMPIRPREPGLWPLPWRARGGFVLKVHQVRQLHLLLAPRGGSNGCRR